MIDFSDFTKRIALEYEIDAGVVGEERNVVALFFIFCTAYMLRKFRLHAIIVSRSGAGKSKLIMAALTPFKNKGDVLEITRMTPAALERLSQSLDGKQLYVSQSFGNEPLSMLPLLSEGDLKLLTVVPDEKGRMIESIIKEAKGMPSFGSTSTTPNLNEEFLRRVVQLTMDESNEQTRRILKAQARSVSVVEAEGLNKFVLTERIIEKLKSFKADAIEEVYLPFADDLLASIPDQVEARSQVPKFIKLIQSIALVKSICYRGYYEALVRGRDGLKAVPRKFVLATKEDFEDAYAALGSRFFQPIPSTALAILEFLKSKIKINEISNQEEYEPQTIKQIMKNLGLKQSTAYKYVDSLCDAGLVSKTEAEVESKREAKLFTYLSSEQEIQLNPSNFDNEKWLKQPNFLEVSFKGIEDPISWEVDGNSFHPCVETTKINSFHACAEPHSAGFTEGKENGYCKACDTNYGSGRAYHEHVRDAHGSRDPNQTHNIHN